MGRYCEQLSLWERDQITIMRLRGESLSGIARHLGRHKATVAREVRRNSSGVDDCYLGHRAQARRHWSPEIIAGRRPLQTLVAGLALCRQYVYAGNEAA